MRTTRVKLADLLAQITQQLQNAQIPRSAREAQLLCMYYFQKDELWLITQHNSEVEVDQEFFSWVDRRCNAEPLEYIVQKVSFYSQEFYIDQGALIPRPETELLIDEVLTHIPDRLSSYQFVEVGIGSGIISILLAQHLPNATFIGVDISKEALRVAQKNIQKFNLESRIKLKHGSFLEPIDTPIDYLVSNPPYIADDTQLEKNLSFEPQNALFGGKIGDEMIKKLLDEVLSRPIRFFSCEMGYDQKGKIQNYLINKQYKKIKFYKDYSDFDRGFTIEV